MKPTAQPCSQPRVRAALGVASLALAALAVSPPAHAELDGAMPEPNLQAARSASAPGSAAARAQSTLLNGALRMRTLTDAGGTTIREYATSVGRIVAYTWAGPTMPDLRALLGKYNVSYLAGATAGAAPAGGNLHSSRISRPDVVVESGGPMRAYVGRAWLPGALPPGVTADDLP